MELTTMISSIYQKYRNIIINVFLSILGFLLIVLIIRFSGTSLKEIINSVFNTKYYYFILIVAMTFGIILFTSLKWKAVVQDLTNLQNTIKGYFFCFSAIGTASNNVVPHIGNYGLKTISLKLSHRVPVVTGTLTVFIEQLFDLLVLVLMLIPSMLFFLNILSLKVSIVFIVIPIMLFSILFLYNHTRMIELIILGYKFIFKVVSRLPFLKNNFQNDFTLLNNVTSLNRKTVIKLFFYSFLKELSIVARIFIVILSLNMHVSFGAVLLAAPLVQTLILIGFIPGALGTLEAGWFGALMLLGVDKAEIGIFLVVLRILGEAALISVTIMGSLYYFINKNIAKPTVAINT